MYETDNGLGSPPGPGYQLPADGPLPDLPLYERLIADGIADADRRGTIIDHVTARPAPGRQHQWEVSWLPGQTLDRNTAITAMTLADTTAEPRPPRRPPALAPHPQLGPRTRPDRPRRDRQGLPAAR